jgi:hypothetical protein
MLRNRTLFLIRAYVERKNCVRPSSKNMYINYLKITFPHITYHSAMKVAEWCSGSELDIELGEGPEVVGSNPGNVVKY